jgi:ABC-type Fe3+ transport system permease subunit
MTTSDDFDFSNHSAADLRAAAASIDPVHYPLSAGRLARELARRWETDRQEGPAVPDAAYRFEDLPQPSARVFFWAYFWRSLGFGIAYAAIIFIVAVSITYVWALVVGLSRGDTSLVVKRLPIVQIIVALVFAVPGTGIALRWLTRTNFTSYGIRIIKGK